MKAIRKNLGAGFLYFYVHFVTEVICFYLLGSYITNGPENWIIILCYDMLAFVPQAIIGYISDRYRKIPFGLMGLGLLSAAPILIYFSVNVYVWLVALCIGNAFTHISGAQITLRVSNGHLSHSAIFVAGGSFGVVTGTLLCQTDIPYFVFSLLAISAVPFVLLGKLYLYNKKDFTPCECKNFNYSKKSICAGLTVILVIFIVAVRGYMGYGIPTSWKKTAFETFLLFVTMGIGKAAGGILSDIFGVKKVAIISAAGALPFLLMGNRQIVISLIGVMLFSMTMSITLALLVSVLKNYPGLSFGLTTIGLFLGTAPVLFFRFNSVFSNCLIITILTIICIIILFAVVEKKGNTSILSKQQ